MGQYIVYQYWAHIESTLNSILVSCGKILPVQYWRNIDKLYRAHIKDNIAPQLISAGELPQTIYSIFIIMIVIYEKT